MIVIDSPDSHSSNVLAAGLWSCSHAVDPHSQLCAGSMVMQNNGEVVPVAPDDLPHKAASVADSLGITGDSTGEGSPSSERRWHAAARCCPAWKQVSGQDGRVCLQA